MERFLFVIVTGLIIYFVGGKILYWYIREGVRDALKDLENEKKNENTR